jgi:hypothetical protein
MSNPNDLLYSVVRHLIRVTPYGTEAEHDVLVRALEIAASANGSTIDPNLDSIKAEIDALNPKPVVVEDTNQATYVTPLDDAPATNAVTQETDAPAIATTAPATQDTTTAPSADGAVA